MRPRRTSPGPAGSPRRRCPALPPRSPTGSGRRLAAMAVDTISGLDALQQAEKQRRPSRLRQAWSLTWPKVAAIALALLVWQTAVWLELKDVWALPPVADVFVELWARAGTPEFWEALLVTGQRAAMGYGFSLVFGITLGVAVARIKLLRVAVGSMITALQTMPSVAWFPLAIL